MIRNSDFASNRSESAIKPSNLYQRNDTFTRRPFFGIQVNHVFRQSECRINYIEHVVVTTRIIHPRRGDLEINLISPQGTKSSLLDTRWRDKVCFALCQLNFYHVELQSSDIGMSYPHKKGWTMSSVQHWGERSQGTWTLTVEEKSNFRDRHQYRTKRLVALKIEIFGTEQPVPQF